MHKKIERFYVRKLSVDTLVASYSLLISTHFSPRLDNYNLCRVLKINANYKSFGKMYRKL